MVKRDNIFVLTGKIRTGKTTAAIKWAKGKNAAGIVQPVIEGKRFFIDLTTEEKFGLTAERGDETIVVGNYIFSAEAFLRARNILSSAINSDSEWIIIDEFGKLEVNNSGLEPTVSELIKIVRSESKKKLLIIIRDYLLEEFLERENLSRIDVFIINSPEKLFYI